MVILIIFAQMNDSYNFCKGMSGGVQPGTVLFEEILAFPVQ